MKLFRDCFFSLLFQLFGGGIILLMYYVVFFFLPFQQLNGTLVVGTLLFAFIYALIWYYFWHIFSETNFSKFISIVLSATLPLILPFIFFHPVKSSDPSVMISFSEYRFDFALYFTTLISFPIYSIVVFKYVITHNHNKIKRLSLTFLLMILVALLLGFIGWTIMPYFYQPYFIQ